MDSWEWLGQFTEVKTPWLTLLGERWRDGQAQTLDYWRVEKADSLIVIPHQGDSLLLPPQQFRPGVRASTWDFPGGRLPPEQNPEATALEILERELQVEPTAIQQLYALNTTGWAINSSFSNQRLWGYGAQIDPTFTFPPRPDGTQPPAFTLPQELPLLLERLTCLQCRALLWEWLSRRVPPDLPSK